MPNCVDIIYSNNPRKLLEWLMEDSSTRWEVLLDILRGKVRKTGVVATFFCENIRFFATGRSQYIRDPDEDDSMDRIAEGLGQHLLVTPTDTSTTRLDNASCEKWHHFEDIVDVLKVACNKADTNVAFSATLDSLRLFPMDASELLILLENIIKRCNDKPQRITTAVGTISCVFERSDDIRPYLTFLRNMWTLEVNDAHNVCKASLRSLALRMHTSIETGRSNFREKGSALLVSNLVCCWEKDMWSWVSRMCVYSSQTELGVLDSSPVDEALCCFRIFTENSSLMPRIYSPSCLSRMYIKVANVLASNMNDDKDVHFDKILVLYEAAVDLLKKCGEYDYFATSLPNEPLALLFGLCSRRNNTKRSVEILKFFIGIATEKALITAFDAVLSRCESDVTMEPCLSAFLDRVANCEQTTKEAAIYTLKGISKRMGRDVQGFSTSLQYVSSWVKTELELLSTGSELFKSTHDLYSLLVATTQNNEETK